MPTTNETNSYADKAWEDAMRFWTALPPENPTSKNKGEETNGLPA